MTFRRSHQVVSSFVVALLLSPPAFALEMPLSSEAVREAYFLGQRRDETMAKFFETYRQHLPAPKSGPHVSTVELLTPYAEAVDLSRQRTLGYSAQQAQLDYQHRGNRVRIVVHVEYTPTYGHGTRGSWKDFQVQLSQQGETLEAKSVRYESVHVGTGGKGGGSWLTGFLIRLEYDAHDLVSDDATVAVDTPDGQHVVATFDLVKLR